MKKVTFVIITACFYLSLGFFYGNANAAPVTNTAAWTWDVLVLPPDEGWDNNAGISIRNTLEWHRLEIIERPDAIHEYEIEFILLPPLTETSAEAFAFPTTPRTVAILSFASEHVNRLLVNSAAATGVPLMLAGGENVFFFNNSRIMPFLFALDLFRDFRCRAFVDYARLTLPRDSRLGIMGARFTLNEERQAVICFDLFTDEGFLPMPFWLDATVRGSFSMVEQEVTQFSDGVLISHIGGMATREVWHGITAGRSPYRIWNGSAPDRSFISFNGMVFADQNMYLEERGGFEQLRRNIWSTRILAIPDLVAAGRANALALWLVEGLAALPRDNHTVRLSELFNTLGNVSGIPFGNQTLDINPNTNRPTHRQVNILHVRNRNFYISHTLNVEGLEYFEI